MLLLLRKEQQRSSGAAERRAAAAAEQRAATAEERSSVSTDNCLGLTVVNGGLSALACDGEESVAVSNRGELQAAAAANGERQQQRRALSLVQARTSGFKANIDQQTPSTITRFAKKCFF